MLMFKAALVLCIIYFMVDTIFWKKQIWCKYKPLLNGILVMAFINVILGVATVVAEG